MVLTVCFHPEMLTCMSDCKGTYRVCSSIEGSTAYRPIFTVANNQTNLLVEEVQLHDGLEFFIFVSFLPLSGHLFFGLMPPKADPTATLSHGVSVRGSQSSSSSPSSDSEEESNLGESRTNVEKRDLELLHGYLQANPKKATRIQAFRESKRKKLTDTQVIKNFQIAVNFLDKVKEKTDWPVRLSLDV
jgi:hypothetical protein